MQIPDLPHGDPLLQHESAEQERGNHVLDALVHKRMKRMYSVRWVVLLIMSSLGTTAWRALGRTR